MLSAFNNWLEVVGLAPLKHKSISATLFQEIAKDAQKHKICFLGCDDVIGSRLSYMQRNMKQPYKGKESLL